MEVAVGEIADMMLDGIMCELCGTFMEDRQAPGYPRKCHCCRRDEQKEEKACRKVKCSLCGKSVKWNGILDHMKVVHPR
jgi:hypothetical protein